MGRDPLVIMKSRLQRDTAPPTGLNPHWVRYSEGMGLGAVTMRGGAQPMSGLVLAGALVPMRVGCAWTTPRRRTTLRTCRAPTGGGPLEPSRNLLGTFSEPSRNQLADGPLEAAAARHGVRPAGVCEG